MNLILLRGDEVEEAGRVVLSGVRARHIAEVLHAKAGQKVRVGVLNGGKGLGIVEESEPKRVVLKCHFGEDVPAVPRIDLLLALPRPKVLKRLWAQLAALGVGRIVLTHAAKVEREYFDTHWLLPENYEPLLIEGLQQAGDTRMPEVTVVRRLKPFIEDELGAMFPDSLRLLAHPGDARPLAGVTVPEGKRILLAIGPEGGWTDFELAMFEKAGATRVSMGPRVLRSDTACVVLMGVAGML